MRALRFSCRPEVFVPITLVLWLIAAPSMAGTVYVPLMTDQVVDGNLIQTEVRLTNHSPNQNQSLSYVFIPELKDGTNRDNSIKVDITLRPRESRLLQDLLSPGETGMLEIEAADVVSVSARLVGTTLSGARTFGAEMPLVSSDSLMAANTDGYIQGWDRTPGQKRTDFHMINLGTSTMTCDAFVYAENGSLLVNGFEFGQPPLSQRSINDVLDLIGIGNAFNVSARFNCDQPFFPYSSIVGLRNGPNNGELLFLGPSASGRSTLLPPSGGDNFPPGSQVFRRLGNFHTPTVGNESIMFDVPMPGNPTFGRIELDMDVTLGPWNIPNNANHAIFWLNRGTRWMSNNFGYVNIFGPTSNTFRLITNAGLPAGQVQRKDQNFAMQSGQTYHVRYVYDTNNNSILLELSQNGQVLVTTRDVPTVNRVSTVENNWFLAFGHHTGAVGPEVPTYGWTYSNLQVVWIP